MPVPTPDPGGWQLWALPHGEVWEESHLSFPGKLLNRPDERQQALLSPTYPCLRPNLHEGAEMR